MRSRRQSCLRARQVLLVALGISLLDASPASAGGRESVGHFIAGPDFLGVDEARRELDQIPDGARSAPATPPSRRLAELDATILAEARRGAELWGRSCRWQGDAGCTWVETRTWPPLREGLDFACTPPPGRRRVAHPREPVMGEHALRHLRRAAAAWRRRARAGEDPPAPVRQAAASALLLLSERAYESLHSIEPPRGLSFEVEAWKVDSGIPEWEEEAAIEASLARTSRRRQLDHVVRLNRDMNALFGLYREILALHELRSSVAVLARSAALAQDWPALLVDASLPRVRPKGEGIAFCHPGLGQEADARATGLYRVCVDAAARHGIHDDPHVDLCRRGIVELDGEERDADEAGIEYVGVPRTPGPVWVGPTGLDGRPLER